MNSSQWLPYLFDLLSFIGGILLGGVIVWLWMKVRNPQKTEELRIKLAELEKGRDSAQEKLEWVENAQQQMKESFEALSSKALQVNSDELIKRSREQTETLLKQARGDWTTQKTEIKGLVEPLKENLTNLDEHVRKLEEKREGAYKGLEEQLRQLSTSHTELQNTTVTLTQALKSPTVRGRWGELQLRRVVEMAGMVKHVAFDEQVSTSSGRPDMTVNLPGGGILPVDSKVPLNSYMEAIEACDEETRQACFGKHAKAVKSRVRELGQKRYWEQFDNTPDFVIMFVPNESCLGAAFENDVELFEYAIDHQVLMTTPVTLLALLKSVMYGWQQSKITENAKSIANEGKELYNRFEVFLRHLVDLQKNLNDTVDVYNKTIGSFEHRILPSVRRLQDLGVSQSELDSPDTIEVQAKLPSNSLD